MRKIKTADVVLMALSGWWIQHVVVYEDGPFKILDKVRRAIDKASHWSVSEPKDIPPHIALVQEAQAMLDCIFCRGPYVGVVVVAVWLLCPLLIVPFAIAGAIVAIDSLIRKMSR